MTIRMPELLTHERWNKGGNLRQLHEEHIYAMLGAKDEADKISPTWMLVGDGHQMVFGTPWRNGGELAAYVSTLGTTMREKGIEMYSMCIPIEMMFTSLSRHEGGEGERCILIVSRSRTEQLVTRFAISPLNRLLERDDWTDAQVGARQGWINTNLLLEDAPELVKELERGKRHEEAHRHHETGKLSLNGAEGVWLLQAVVMTLTSFVNEQRDQKLGDGNGYRFREGDFDVTIVVSTGSGGDDDPLRCVCAGSLDREVMMKMFESMGRDGPDRSQNICSDDI